MQDNIKIQQLSSAECGLEANWGLDCTVVAPGGPLSRLARTTCRNRARVRPRYPFRSQVASEDGGRTAPEQVSPLASDDLVMIAVLVW